LQLLLLLLCVLRWHVVQFYGNFAKKEQILMQNPYQLH